MSNRLYSRRGKAKAADMLDTLLMVLVPAMPVLLFIFIVLSAARGFL